MTSFTLIIKKAFETHLSDLRYQVFMYGSSVTGLALKGTSDLDLTILVLNDPLVDHLTILQSLDKEVRECLNRFTFPNI